MISHFHCSLLARSSFSEVARTRFAITELLQNDLLEQMHVYEEPESEVVAQYKFVVMITANGPKRASDPKANPALFVSEKKIEDQAILGTNETDPLNVALLTQHLLRRHSEQVHLEEGQQEAQEGRRRSSSHH